jgi:hypothetical protein
MFYMSAQLKLVALSHFKVHGLRLLQTPSMEFRIVLPAETDGGDDPLLHVADGTLCLGAEEKNVADSSLFSKYFFILFDCPCPGPTLLLSFLLSVILVILTCLKCVKLI